MANSQNGDVTYEIRADSSMLSKDLDEAHKKVKQSTKKTNEEIKKIEKEKNNYIKNEQRSVTENHNNELESRKKAELEIAKSFKQINTSTLNDFEATITRTKKVFSGTAEEIKNPMNEASTCLKETAECIEETFNVTFKNVREEAITSVEATAQAIVQQEETIKGVTKGIEEETSQLGEKTNKTFGEVAKKVGSSMLSVGKAAIDVGTKAVKSAISMDEAMDSFIVSTGKGADEAESYQNVLEEIYKNNYGEDFQDIADAMGQVTNTMGDMSDASLQSITESAFLLKDVFKYDLEESTNAAKVMMEQFGVSGEEAMNLIAAGAQTDKQYSAELLDSISQYSEQFSKAGFSADDMFKIFQAGAETGNWSLETVSNAIGEMSNRAIEGLDKTKNAFSEIGLNADEMSEKFAAGGESAKEAFQETISALAELDSHIDLNAAGADIFGESWSEIGPEVVKQLADIEEGAFTTGEELNSFKEMKFDDLGSMFEKLKRIVEMLLLPIGEQLIPILSELLAAIMPIIEDALPPFIEVVGQLIEQLSPVIKEILPELQRMFEEIRPLLMDMASAILPILVDVFKALMPAITDIISGVLPVLVELINALLPIIQILINLLMPVIDLFMELLQPILSLISDALTPLLGALTPIIAVITDLLVPILRILMTVFSEVFAGIVENISERIQIITNIINGIVDFIKNVFTGNWKSTWENIKDIFKNIVEGFKNIFKIPINAIIDLVNGFIKGINKIKVPDWVPGIGGKSISIPIIKRLRIGMEYIPSDDFPALLHKGEAVLTAQENALYRSVGGFHGIMMALSERGYHDAQNTKNGTLIIHSHVELDGKQVGYSVTPYVDNRLAENEDLRRRGI